MALDSLSLAGSWHEVEFQSGWKPDRREVAPVGGRDAGYAEARSDGDDRGIDEADLGNSCQKLAGEIEVGVVERFEGELASQRSEEGELGDGAQPVVKQIADFGHNGDGYDAQPALRGQQMGGAVVPGVVGVRGRIEDSSVEDQRHRVNADRDAGASPAARDRSEQSQRPSPRAKQAAP